MLGHQVGINRSEDLAVLQQRVRSARRHMEGHIELLEALRDHMLKRGVSLVEEGDEGDEMEFIPK